MQASMLKTNDSRNEIVTTIVTAYGPWPDFWSEDADHRAMAQSASLKCTQLYDATSNTHPSHRFTTPKDKKILK
ncbi:MAG: hypothetical protein ACKVHQ_09840 [Gammaproteobacteria bacterium]|jgi:hypothetical protein